MAATDPFSDSVIGYPKLAAKFGVLPEAAIYRRFGALNAQDLLYYQAELTYLEQKLQEQQQQDNNDPKGHGASYAINWYWLKHSKTDGDGRQYELVMQIRELLKQYSGSKVPYDSMSVRLTILKTKPLFSRQRFWAIKNPANGIFITSRTTFRPTRWVLSHYAETMRQFGGPSTTENHTSRIWSS